MAYDDVVAMSGSCAGAAQAGQRSGSCLCEAWARAGTDMFAGSLRTAADVTDDFSYDECGSGSSRRRKDRDDR